MKSDNPPTTCKTLDTSITITVYIRIGQSHCVSRVNQKKLCTPGLCKANNNKNHFGKHWGAGPHVKPYSSWTCPTPEHTTHLGTSPSWNTLLTMDLPHRRTPYSPWTLPTWNTLLTVDLPHRGTPYSPWTCPTWNTLLTQQRRPLKLIASDSTTTDNSQHTDLIVLGADSVKK